MSNALARASNQFPPSAPAPRWILSLKLDLVLFVLTPLLIVPLVFLLQAPYFGVETQTISLIVISFGALGHHFPGLIRSYFDRDLFERFWIRFTLAPVLIFAAYFPLAQYHKQYLILILTTWGCWHGLMQVYGFVRIYDAKVGSISQTTANWDWLMCLCWFVTAEFFTNNKPNAADQLQIWYHIHGARSPVYVQMFGWICLAISILVLIGFSSNHVIQARRGSGPNPAKLLMLASGIGFWWYAMVTVENPILGVALFEIFHDIQYLAIVWLYNCRRVKSNPTMNLFMKILFRPGMLFIYVGLVFAYGLVGFVPQLVQDGTLKSIFTGIVTTSAILHFYSDGFIWKIRENSTKASLGLAAGDAALVRQESLLWRGFPHILKWSPLMLFVGWLFVTDIRETTAKVDPEEHQAEAIEFLESLLARSPENGNAHRRLGEIHKSKGAIEKATECFLAALACTTNKDDRTIANHRLGEIYRDQKQLDLARSKFEAALHEDPEFLPARNELNNIAQNVTINGAP